MPLYDITRADGTTERVRTVAGSHDDKRLAADGRAKVVDEATPAEPGKDVRRGRGRATVDVAGTPAQGG